MGRTGLYFRNGRFLTRLWTQSGDVTLQYGALADPTYSGIVAGVGDPITPDLSLADAVLTVCGLAPATDASVSVQRHDGMDISSGNVRLISPEPGEFRSSGEIFSGRVNVVGFPGEASGHLTLFFDLVNDEQAPLLVASLNQAVGRDYEARLSSFRGLNSETNAQTIADVAITFFDRGEPGSNHFIDFNFLLSDCGPGTSFPVRAVGVPEPATWCLSASGVFTVGIAWSCRRRGRRRQFESLG